MAAESLSSDDAATRSDTHECFQKIEDYDWSSDSDFQHGLAAILSSNLESGQEEHLTLRVRCFYFSRYVNRPPDTSLNKHVDLPSGNQYRSECRSCSNRENEN